MRFRDLLREFEVPDAPLEETQEELEDKRLEAIGRCLAGAGLELRVEAVGEGWRLEVLLDTSAAQFERGDGLAVRPVSRTAWVDARIGASPVAVYELRSRADISALLAVRLTGPLGLTRDFVLVGELIGAPSDRREQLILDLIPDERRFRLLLFLMLAAGDPDADASSVARQLASASDDVLPAGEGELGIPLYEALVRAASRDPARLHSIDRMVERLKRTEAGRERLPDGFEAMWESFAPLARRAA